MSASLCSVAVQARTAAQRDVEGYAIATCLTKQSEPYLKDQGDAWASVIVQRSHGDLDPFHALQAAEIIDDASVRAAIDKAIKQLTPAYRRAKK